MIYSPQMLNTFEECPVKYFYKFIKNINTPQLDKSFSVGKNIHALAAYYLKGDDVSLFALDKNEQQMWDRLLSNKTFNLKTELVETNVACKIDDFWIGGRLDALVTNNSNEYYILDYKTGGIPKNSKYNFQTIIYLLCCDNMLKDKYKKLYFTYISVKNGESEIIEFNNQLKEEYITKLRNTISGIKKLTPPMPKHNKQCEYCGYIKVCV
ncbi:MAG: PD-(D/E)XK nuclease family protein [Candidatus Gastranaerophilaceae bacterium]